MIEHLDTEIGPRVRVYCDRCGQQVFRGYRERCLDCRLARTLRVMLAAASVSALAALAALIDQLA